MKATGEVLAGVSLKNILYATDFSSTSEAALPVALGIARKYGAAVHALHVRMPNPYWPMGLEAASEMIVTEKELAQRDADRLHSMLGSVPHDVTVAEGDIWTPLTEMISRHNIDLIVVGTHGRAGVAKVALGSIAAEIIRSVPCPVLTVGRQVVPEPKEPIEFQRILFATDLEPTAHAILPYATMLAQDNKAELILLKVTEKEEAGDLIDRAFCAEFDMKRLHEFLPEDGNFGKAPKYIVETGDAAETILNVAHENKVNLIILGAKNVNGLLTAATHFSRATAQRVIAGAPCPVLTVPEANRESIT